MKKSLRCFIFLLIYIAGLVIGVISSGWLYPTKTDNNRDLSVSGNEIAYDEVETIPYPEESWCRKLLFGYVLYYGVTVILLDLKGKPVIILLGWLIYGGFSGIYIRGISWLYGSTGNGYCVTGWLVMPVVPALVTGFYWKQAEENRRPFYSTQKRIQDVLNNLRIRFTPAVLYATAIFIWFLIDYEIIRRLQWTFLLRMLRNVVK